MTALKSILVMVLAVAIVGGALAVAQPRERDGDRSERRAGPRSGERHALRSGLAADLAKKLGVSAAQVRRALRETLAEKRGGMCEEKDAALAKELGVSVERLREAKRSARGPRALAEELGITPEKLREAMIAAREARCTELTNAFAERLGKPGDEVRAAIRELASEKLDAAVKTGRLSEERAARIRERIASSACFGLPLGHHRFGHHRRGFHRFRERFREGERRDGSFEPRRGERVPA